MVQQRYPKILLSDKGKLRRTVQEVGVGGHVRKQHGAGGGIPAQWVMPKRDVWPSDAEQLGIGTRMEMHGCPGLAGSQPQKHDMLLKVLGSFSSPKRKEAVTGK